MQHPPYSAPDKANDVLYLGLLAVSGIAAAVSDMRNRGFFIAAVLVTMILAMAGGALIIGLPFVLGMLGVAVVALFKGERSV